MAVLINVCVCVCVCVRARALMRVLLCTRQTDGVTDDRQTDTHNEKTTHKTTLPFLIFQGRQLGGRGGADRRNVRADGLHRGRRQDRPGDRGQASVHPLRQGHAGQEFEDKRQFIVNNPPLRLLATQVPQAADHGTLQGDLPYESMMVRQGDPVEFVYFILRYLGFVCLWSLLHTEVPRLCLPLSLLHTEVPRLCCLWSLLHTEVPRLCLPLEFTSH